MVTTFGFNDYTLTSKNALLPIIYYIYYKDITRNFCDSVSNISDKGAIRKWLHTMLILKIFGGQSDAILTQIRNVYTSDISSVPIDSKFGNFPSMEIRQGISKDTTLSDEFIINLLKTQKDDQYAFSILAVLFPNMDYKNNNFHKDHMHPISSFSEKNAEYLGLDEDEMSEFFDPAFNNSIINLQMLDANENMSKNDKTLKEWVDNEIQHSDRITFFRNHLIPDVSLELAAYKTFRNEREKILVLKLKDEIGK